MLRRIRIGLGCMVMDRILLRGRWRLRDRFRGGSDISQRHLHYWSEIKRRSFTFDRPPFDRPPSILDRGETYLDSHLDNTCELDLMFRDQLGESD